MGSRAVHRSPPMSGAGGQFVASVMRLSQSTRKAPFERLRRSRQANRTTLCLALRGRFEVVLPRPQLDHHDGAGIADRQLAALVGTISSVTPQSRASCRATSASEPMYPDVAGAYQRPSHWLSSRAPASTACLAHSISRSIAQRTCCPVGRFAASRHLLNSGYHFFFRSEATASAPGVVPAGASGSGASGNFFGFLASLFPCLPLVMWAPWYGVRRIFTARPSFVCALTLSAAELPDKARYRISRRRARSSLGTAMELGQA